MQQNLKKLKRTKRHNKILLRMHGTASRPRIFVRRSLNHLYATAIDDTQGKVLFSLSTLDKAIRQKSPVCANVKSAQVFGEEFARRVKEKGVQKIIFDRAGYLYHGRVKAFAEALRKGGIEF